jgi:hypothetical protein
MYVVSLILCCLGQEAKADPTERDVAKARKAFESTSAKLKADLLETLDSAIEKKTKSGDLGGVEQLKKERAALAEEGIAPTSPLLARQVAQYERGMKTARTALENSLNRGIKSYVRASETEKAKALQEELDRIRAGSGTQIALKALVPTNGLQLIPSQNGMILKFAEGADRGNARTPQQFAPPFAIVARVATDGTNIRTYYGAGSIILNWEVNKSELRVQDPATGQVSGVRDKGSVTPNAIHEVVWEIHLDKMRLLVDGVERYQQTGNYSQLKSEVSIGPAHGSTLILQSLSIRPLPQGKKSTK